MKKKVPTIQRRMLNSTQELTNSTQKKHNLIAKIKSLTYTTSNDLLMPEQQPRLVFSPFILVFQTKALE